MELNEQRALAKIFADGWGPLDLAERRELLRELNLDEGHSELTGAGVAEAVLAGKAGPFALYKLSRVVANSVARALPPGRLKAARRKTLQAVALVASLRQAQRTALADGAREPRGACRRHRGERAGSARAAPAAEGGAPGRGALGNPKGGCEGEGAEEGGEEEGWQKGGCEEAARREEGAAEEEEGPAAEEGAEEAGDQASSSSSTRRSWSGEPKSSMKFPSGRRRPAAEPMVLSTRA